MGYFQANHLHLGKSPLHTCGCIHAGDHRLLAHICTCWPATRSVQYCKLLNHLQIGKCNFTLAVLSLASNGSPVPFQEWSFRNIPNILGRPVGQIRSAASSSCIHGQALCWHGKMVLTCFHGILCDRAAPELIMREDSSASWTVLLGHLPSGRRSGRR